MVFMPPMMRGRVAPPATKPRTITGIATVPSESKSKTTPPA
jgi:hypothetical protein